MASLDFNDIATGYAKAWTKWKFTEDEVQVQQMEDVTDIISVNKYLQGFTAQELTNKKAGWRWVARLPLSLDLELLKNGTYKSKAAFNKWKNDPDNAVWALSRDIKLLNKGKS